MRRLAQRPWAPLIMISLIAMLCSALAAGWAQERQDRLEQVAALQAQIESNNAMCKASTYGVAYALRSEQAKCGAFEAQRNFIREQLSDNRGYVDNLVTSLEQCQAMNRMLQSGWTGNAIIDPEG